MNKWASLTTLVQVEFTILFFFIIIIIFSSSIYEIKYRTRIKKRAVIEQLLTSLITAKMYGNDAWIPNRLRVFSLFIPVLEDLNKKIKSPLWSMIKEWIIHDLFQEDLNDHMVSQKWEENYWAVRALNLSPHVRYFKEIEAFAKSPKPLLRFATIPYLINMEVKESIELLLKTMVNEMKDY